MRVRLAELGWLRMRMAASSPAGGAKAATVGTYKLAVRNREVGSAVKTSRSARASVSAQSAQSGQKAGTWLELSLAQSWFPESSVMRALLVDECRGRVPGDRQRRRLARCRVGVQAPDGIASADDAHADGLGLVGQGFRR